MSEFVGLRAKTCSYLIHNSSEDKKAKDTKKCAIERKPKFETIKIFKSNSRKNEIDVDSLKKYHK